jgi:hypothetical protein
MPRRLPIRPSRPSKPSSLHPSLQFSLNSKRSLVRRQTNRLEAQFKKKVPPKIVALDSVPRLPLIRTPTDYTRSLARIEQIKQLYSPREFKRLRDEQMQLVLPESPLKTAKGRFRLGLVFWIYFSMMV